MANARKLPSGRWSCQAYVGRKANGQKIIKTFTADTKKEAEFLASEYLHSGNYMREITVAKAIRQYIELNRNNLSPSTVRGYDTLYRTAYEPILAVPINRLDKIMLQRWIAVYGASRSPKTVRNAFALLNSACKLQNCELPEVKLPKKKEIEYKIPTDMEVQEIISYFRSCGKQEMVVAIMLGAYGQMRRGEIAALTSNDIRGNVCHISKDIVKNEKKEWVVKPPKTESSNRYITLPDFVIAELPNKEGNLFTMTPEKISNCFNQTLRRKLNMPYNFHSLRHYGTSTIIANSKKLGLDMLYVQKRGGWKRQETMMNVYRNVMPEYFAKSDEKVIGLFNSFNEGRDSCGQICGQKIDK